MNVQSPSDHDSNAIISDLPTLALIVIRVANIDQSAEFYSKLGLHFERESHNNGPEHFACTLGGTVLELYPATDKYLPTQTRLGFVVTSVVNVVDTCRNAQIEIVSEPKDSPWGIRAIVADPDGNRVELTQKPICGPVPRELLEVYSTESNYAVIKPPGRNFPGSVIQGDSLSILCETAKTIAEAVRDGTTSHEDFLGEVEDLLHSLVDRLLHYQTVLQKYGVSLPYSQPICENDFLKLTPDDDEL
ncbi:MAG: VOC family protein [Planctomycetota bacterium]